jgi:YVTN family beta-propeller protein
MGKKVFYLLLSFTCLWGVWSDAWGAPFAYITNYSSNDVSVIDTATHTVVGSPIPIGSVPYGVAVNPSGTRVYVANVSNSVTVIDTETNTVIDSPIAVGRNPHGVAVNPSGTRVYVANYGDDTISVIDTATNTVIGSPIPVEAGPWGVAVNPSGKRLFVTSYGSNTVSVINTATGRVIGSPIQVGTRSEGVAVSPSGKRLYVTSYYDDNVYVIDTATRVVIGSPIPVGGAPLGVAVSPTSTWVYVANSASNNVSVIDAATNTVIGSPIPVGTGPIGLAVSPTGTWVYVANSGSGDVSVIDAATNTVIGSPIPVGEFPVALGHFIGPAVSLGEGTIGTEFTITGSGFGTTKGKVLIGKVALKILEWTDSLISCQLKEAMPPGTRKVTIRPKARKASSIIIKDGFTVEAPQIESAEPTSGSIGEEITVKGFFFGTEKGKVTLRKKRCKVLSWTMDPQTGESEIHFVVRQGLTPGIEKLKVTNEVGSGTTNFTVE